MIQNQFNSINIKVHPSTDFYIQSLEYLVGMNELLAKTPTRTIGMFEKKSTFIRFNYFSCALYNFLEVIGNLLFSRYSELYTLALYCQYVGLHDRRCEKYFVHASDGGIWHQRETSTVRLFFSPSKLNRLKVTVSLQSESKLGNFYSSYERVFQNLAQSF